MTTTAYAVHQMSMLIGYSLLNTIVQQLMAISFYLFVLIAFLLFLITQAGQSDQPGPSRRRFELVDESVVSLLFRLSILPLLKRISQLTSRYTFGLTFKPTSKM